MGATQSSPSPPPIYAPFTPSHPYILSVPGSALPYGCECSSADFLNACIQDPASEETYVTKVEYNMSGDLNAHHWLVLWLAGNDDDEPVAMVVWDANHDAEAREAHKKRDGEAKLKLLPWAEIFAAAVPPREAYLKSRTNVTTVASQPYDDSGISLLEFAYLAQTAQKLYPSLRIPGLPCRWMAHLLFRAMSSFQEQSLPPAYIGKINGFDEKQIEMVVVETRKALAGHTTRGMGERMLCGQQVAQKVRERVTLIQLSSTRNR